MLPVLAPQGRLSLHPDYLFVWGVADHHSFIPGIGVIHTLGPQDGAPGLHNTTGAEIIALPGCG